MLKIKPEVRKALILGGLCSISYLAVYFARNTLSVVSPQMEESGVFTNEQIGLLSSVYLFSYAIGQLVNGIVGNKVKAKYMISLGLILAGICIFLMTFLSSIPIAAYMAYAFTGFFLSMIYGPMVKVVSENTEPIYATRCSIGYTFSSFIGSPMAGIFAMFLAWQGVFMANSMVLITMGVLCFLAFSILERKKMIAFKRIAPPKEKGGGIKVLLKHQIVKFTLISFVTGIIRTSVVFWLPTYISQRLNFPAETAAFVFTLATLAISSVTFIAIFLYERLGYNMDLTILIVFISAVLCFTGVYFIRQPIVNIILLVLGIISSSAADSMMWCRYCPSLRDTGMVSAATGFLDFISYMSAALASSIFANAVSVIGWSGLVLVWLALMVFGVIISLPYNKMKKKVSVF